MISLSAIHEARRVIADTAIRTPLIRLNVPDVPAEVYLKLENLQPIGSFKIRGAANAIARLSTEQLQRGVVTASAGNMAQGGGVVCAKALDSLHRYCSSHRAANENQSHRTARRPGDTGYV